MDQISIDIKCEKKKADAKAYAYVHNVIQLSLCFVKYTCPRQVRKCRCYVAGTMVDR